MATGENHPERQSRHGHARPNVVRYGRALESRFEGIPLTVRQPEKIRSLLAVLCDLEKISEVVSEDKSGDLGAGTGTGTGTGMVSLRDQAIRNLPGVPVMRRRVTRHLKHEVLNLERSARRLARSARKGSAYMLNELYARIRKIQAFIAELAEAATETVRGLYIRLFIDHQELV